MTALQQIEAYLAKLDQRLKLFGTLRGLAVSLLSALGLTLVLTLIGNHYRFAEGVTLPLRLCLFGGIAGVLVFAFVLPLLRINRRNTAQLAEAKVSDFGERLITLTERRNAENPFNELVAEDALRVAHSHPASQFVPSSWLAASIAGAAAGLMALVWLITSAPGFWGYGASLLWTSSGRVSAPLYDIHVAPGNATVRRRTDQIISAELKGFSASTVILHAKYHDALKWEQIPMQAQPSTNGYQLLFAGLSDSLEYFVEAGGSQSKHFTLAVKDLPAVKHLRVAIHFPEAVGLPDSVEDPGGDIRALEGSKAEIKVLTDKPLQGGVIVMENGSRIPLLAGKDNWLTASVPIQKDGSYHIAAMDRDEAVRMTDNYIIEARKDEAPTVAITHPGKDAGVSPIEELPVSVASSDDFGLRGVDLHYSINGGPEQVKNLAGANNSKSQEGKTVLPLEEYKLAPGDLVSFYATAKDAAHTARSDIFFAKVEPFDLKFRQSQQAGGQGQGAGEQDSKISERQKDIVAATWNQIKDPSKDPAAITQNAHFLSDLESKLGEQAKALAERMNNRELGQDSQQFKEFSKSIQDASAQMSQAVTQLQPGKWSAALGPEQKALQSLLHAESLFRDIQVSMGQSSGGGQGGGGQERDLARLFDLELDTAKNQYESAQSGSKSHEDTQKQLNEELERLKELARRQQQLASEQHSQQQQFQQKWEEEQLRREAEQLRQQLQQQQQQQSAQGSQQQQSGSQSASSSSSSASGSASSRANASKPNANSSAQRDALRQTMDALSKAEDEMRDAASKNDAMAQQRAANQLTQAQNAMRDMLHQQASNSLSDLAEKARQLSASQNDLAQRIKKQYGTEGINMARADDKGNPVMPEMNGPGYGGYYRRRQQPIPDQPASQQEKSLAEENDKLADQVQQLQKQLQDQAQSLASQQPETTRKIRKALSDAEQEEIAVRMRKSSEWLRQGFGSKTWPVEDGITAATQHLSRQLDDARKTAENNQTGKQPGEQGSLGEALAQVRSLREQLAAQSQQGQGQRGQGSQQGGTSPSSNSTTPGQRGGEQQSSLDQLAGLRAQFGRDDRQLNGYFNDAMGALRHMDGQQGLMDARLSSNAMQTLERLEVELARRMGQKAGARTGAGENVPEGYRDAVATYFRSLSK